MTRKRTSFYSQRSVLPALTLLVGRQNICRRKKAAVYTRVPLQNWGSDEEVVTAPLAARLLPGELILTGLNFMVNIGLQ